MAEYQDWHSETTTGSTKMSGDGKGGVQHDVQKGAKTFVEEGRRRGKGILEEQKSGVSDSVQRFSSALEKAAHDLEEDQPLSAKIFRNGAEALNNFSRTLRERDTETLYHQAQDFTRRQPALMIGGAIVGGFILLRLLKSSPEHTDSDYRQTEQQPISAAEPFAAETEGFSVTRDKEESIYGNE